MMQVDRVALWIFPPEDFADWRELVGEVAGGVEDYRHYLTLIAALQADVERTPSAAQKPRGVVRVHLSVAEMRSALARNALTNTPQNRAAVIAAAAGREP